MKTILIFDVLTLLMLLMLGCASGQYAKSGGTDQEFLKDKTDCQVKAKQAGFENTDFASGIRYRRFYDQCLHGQGWSKI